MLPLIVLLATIAGAWYLLIVRPQRDQQTRHGRLVERLQVGDHVLTVGGIYGQVTDVTPTSVELRLGPGTTTRIATDGIARIVHESESSLALGVETPQPPQPQNPVETMQHPPQPPQHDQYAQPTHAPIASGFAPPPVPAFAPQPVAHAPVPGTMTFRAQVVPVGQPHHAQPSPDMGQAAPAPSAAPPIHAPWADVRPVDSRAQPTARPLSSGFQLPPPPVLVQQPTQAPVALQPHTYQHQPQQAPVPQYAPAPAVQYAPAPPLQYAPAPVQYAPAPVQYAPAPLPQPVAAAPTAPVGGEAAKPGRRHSAAPQGMGSSLRLDDPSLVDTMVRARQERAGLAQEYRQAIAPLVDTSQHHAHAHAPQPAAGYPVDPAGMYAAPQQPHMVAHVQTGVYPAPARPDAFAEPTTMPRPVVGTLDGPPDPAFQRRTPMTQSTSSPYPAPVTA